MSFAFLSDFKSTIDSIAHAILSTFDVLPIEYFFSKLPFHLSY